MHQWRIDLEHVGAQRLCATLTVRATDLAVAKRAAIQECRKVVPLPNLFLEARGDGLYTLVAGLQDAGLVRIQRPADPSKARTRTVAPDHGPASTRPSQGHCV
ncbi:MAG: hypothetical protein KBE04_09330 [Phycisphaerae bacterium]|nr:hypothetical protein [Phycisphaerae bacterium]